VSARRLTVLTVSFDLQELDLSDDVVATAVHRIGLRAYAVEAALIGFEGIPALSETLDEMQARPLRWLGALGPGGLPVAFLAWQHTEDGVDIDRLCVDPAWFRRGLATLLLDRVLARADVVTVATAAANVPAIALYECRGFEHDGTVEPEPGLLITRFRRHAPAGI
jgi:ribosomal protein S18 acetylase RimI-like enzyme